MIAEIKKIPAGERTQNKLEYGGATGFIGCRTILAKFAVKGADANGNLVQAGTINGFTSGVALGADCGGGLGLHTYNLQQPSDGRGFVPNAFRLNGTAPAVYSQITYFCRTGSDPAACSPASPNFIAGLKWAPASLSFDPAVRTWNLSRILLPHGVDQDASCLEQYMQKHVRDPLVIQKDADQGVQALDPQSTETYLDLTGTGVKERVSCVKNAAFLALPQDAQGNPDPIDGKVLNIDQLFGDQTKGPGADGKRDSANGFVALGKYDRKSLKDGYGVLFADQDEIFGKLRLWEDRDCDGVAQAQELFPLSAWNITAIRWGGYEEMYEVDAFGNETLQRSVVDRLNGLDAPLAIFDLWFSIGGRSQVPTEKVRLSARISDAASMSSFNSAAPAAHSGAPAGGRRSIFAKPIER